MAKLMYGRAREASNSFLVFLKTRNLSIKTKKPKVHLHHSHFENQAVPNSLGQQASDIQ